MLLAGEGLHHLLAGFWMWKVNSMDEAVEWVKRCPPPSGPAEVEIEIRPPRRHADVIPKGMVRAVRAIRVRHPGIMPDPPTRQSPKCS